MSSGTKAGLVYGVSEEDFEAHTSDTGNPHSVTAAQAGAIPDQADAVTQDHIALASVGLAELDFDPATQAELDAHLADVANPHSVTAAQAGAIPDLPDAVTQDHIALASVGLAELDFDPATQAELDTAIDGVLSRPSAGYVDQTANVSFGTPRTPNSDRPTLVVAAVQVVNNATSLGLARLLVDTDIVGQAVIDQDGGLNAVDFRTVQTITVLVPAGSSYEIQNAADPKGENSIERVHEMTL